MLYYTARKRPGGTITKYPQYRSSGTHMQGRGDSTKISFLRNAYAGAWWFYKDIVPPERLRGVLILVEV